MKTCVTCRSPNLARRGTGFRDQCQPCCNKDQRDKWAASRDACLAASRANYAKHAAKRRNESAARKQDNREYYTLAEWFRRKGISVSHIPRDELDALIEMKKAVKLAKTLSK